MWNLWLIAVLSWALAAFFALGSWLNTFDVHSIADYRKWGYPDWFHYVTAGMELVSAALLVLAVTRAFGAALGCVIMIGAVSTLILHRDYTHAVLPTAILALLLVVGWATLRA